MGNKRENRLTSWINFVFLIALTSSIIIGALLIFSTKGNTNAALSNEKANRIPSSTVDTIDSKYPGFKINTETSNDQDAPYAIQYPQSLHNSFNEEVSTYINEVKQNYLNQIKSDKESNKNSKSELNISFETLLHHSGNYSFVLVTNHYTAGKNDLTEIRSFHSNPKTGTSLTIRDVFDQNPERLTHLTTLVRKAISTDITLSKSLVQKEVNLATKPLWNNFSNFALTNEDLIFYYDENQFADKLAGPPIIAIPLEEVESIIAPDFKKKDNQVLSETDSTSDDLQKKPIDETEAETAVPPADSNIKSVALTFDDGPHPKVTRQILATLQKHEAKATFFMLGSRVEYYPDIAKEVSDAGHELGNHSWNHPDLTKATIEKVRAEINNTSAIIKEATGQEATVFRPPYGATNDTVSEHSTLPIILWDVDTLDWKHRNADQLLPIIKGSVKDGSNILMHDIHQSTADGLDRILTYLTSEGFTFVTVSELK